jgi:hypothetical protein
VALLPETLQGKLLKVIEERVVRRLGSIHGEPTDIWIVAATSEDLAGATRARCFGDAGHAYRVVAREPTGHGLGGRPLTPFVGRAREMALLDAARARVAGGHGQVVALVGDQGVGSSRITYELACDVSQRGWLALEGRAVSYGVPVPYLPLADPLTRYFGLGEADAPRDVHEKIRTRLGALADECVASMLTPVLAVLGGSVEDDEWRRLDPAHPRERIFDALTRLVVAESRIQALLVVMDESRRRRLGPDHIARGPARHAARTAPLVRLPGGEALFNVNGAFVRTPKFRMALRGSRSSRRYWRSTVRMVWSCWARWADIPSTRSSCCTPSASRWCRSGASGNRSGRVCGRPDRPLASPHCSRRHHARRPGPGDGGGGPGAACESRAQEDRRAG